MSPYNSSMLKPALLAAASALAVATTLHAQTPTRAFTLDDVAKLKHVSDPERSPDGKWVAYTVSAADTEKDKRDSDVWMVSWDGSEQVRLTSSKDSESHPQWSPDGKYLAFLTSRGNDDEDDEKKNKKKGAQVWLLNRAGGEAEKLTDIEGDIDDCAWSPDSKRLVLVVDDPDPAADPEKMEGWKRKTKPPIVIDRYAFKNDQSGYLGKLRSHLYLFDIAAKKAEQITSGDFDDRDATWSPDGTRIAFVSERDKDPDRTNNTDIYVIDAKAGATPTKLTSFAGPDNGKPAWSPDGKSIAYVQGDEPRFYAYNLAKLAVIPSAGGTPRILTESLDRTVSVPLWSKDGTSILVVVEDDRAQYLARVPASGGAVEPLTTGRRVVNALSLGGDGNVAVTSSTTSEPFEVYALDQGKLRKLTSQNAWASDIAFAKVEDVTFTARDGTTVNGLLSRPAAAQPGQKLPLILWIHGGPNGQDDHSFDDEREYFAANGYAVLQVNYRGSSGRGSKYQKAIYADWGNLEVVDLQAGVDWAVKAGVADPERLAIGGWSYGGILTDYMIATDPRFRAANSGAGSALQLSMYGSDQYIMQYETELGPPWKSQDLWIKVSYPFFHADRIKTPTLFMASEKDFNVPVVGAEQMYQALRSNGVDTQLVIYPDQHHGVRVPSYVRDRFERRLAWFNKYLKAGAAQPVPAPTGTKQ
jgi:dipeptidyl aminopeptidase/acylaminoacyl peptidase